MKITIVQGAFLPVPALLGGAVEKVWHALSREFAASGHAVTHVSRKYGDLPREETSSGVRHLRGGGFDAPRSLFLLKALDLLYSIRVLRSLPPGDILVTNTFWLPFLLRDVRRGRIYMHVARYPKGQMRFYSRAARLQTVSHSVAEAIRKEAPKLASRVKVIPYPLVEPPQTARPARGGRERQILYVGRVHPEKGVHLLLRAVAALPPELMKSWRLIIAGPSEVKLGGGGEGYLRQLIGLAQPMMERVEWRGAVFDPAHLGDLYRGSAIFVYPSLADRGETFGLAPLEAMSHGCAPVVSSLACFRDFIEEGVDGLYFDETGDHPTQRLAKCLEALMRDRARCASIGAAALRKSARYNLQDIASLYLQDFESLLDSAGGQERSRDGAQSESE